MTVSDGTGSNFWQEKSCGGSLRKYTSTQVVNLSALAMLASITSFILRCFQLGETNGAGATASWSWRETTPPSRYPVTLSHHKCHLLIQTQRLEDLAAQSKCIGRCGQCVSRWLGDQTIEQYIGYEAMRFEDLTRNLLRMRILWTQNTESPVPNFLVQAWP